MPTNHRTLKARREALAAQRSSGVARVSYDGKTVRFTAASPKSTEPSRLLDREIELRRGAKIIRQVRVITSKGL